MMKLILIYCSLVRASNWIKLPSIERNQPIYRGELINLTTLSEDSLQRAEIKTFDDLDEVRLSIRNQSFHEEIEGRHKHETSTELIIEDNFSPKYSNETFKNEFEEDDNIFDIKTMSSLLTQLQDNIFTNFPIESRDKTKFLKNMHDNILINIGEKLSFLWPSKNVRNSRAMKGSDHHLDFPSAESALMTISFLTFAVYLIKLILQVINILKAKKTMMYTPMITTAGRRFNGNDAYNQLWEERDLILNQMRFFDTL